MVAKDGPDAHTYYQKRERAGPFKNKPKTETIFFVGERSCFRTNIYHRV